MKNDKARLNLTVSKDTLDKVYSTAEKVHMRPGAFVELVLQSVLVDEGDIEKSIGKFLLGIINNVK